MTSKMFKLEKVNFSINVHLMSHCAMHGIARNIKEAKAVLNLSLETARG